MSAAAAPEFAGAIKHLPPGATLRMDDVSWDDYENLLADLGESSHVRVFYDRGRMEIISPASIHEKPKNVVHDLITILRSELDIEIESLGSTTYKEELRTRGAEPDDSIYIHNASAVIGQNRNLDLSIDPPPDLVIEIDNGSSSLDKLPIYSGLRVPELWRIYHQQVRICVLSGDQYKEVSHSAVFPFLPADTLSKFVEMGISKGMRKTEQEFREWVRLQRSSIE